MAFSIICKMTLKKNYEQNSIADYSPPAPCLGKLMMQFKSIFKDVSKHVKRNRFLKSACQKLKIRVEIIDTSSVRPMDDRR